MKKRGQISIIIILALVIAVLSTVFYIFYYSSAKSKAAAEVSKSISDDYLPVISYLEESIKQAAVEGIIKMGEQGGKLIEPYEYAEKKGAQPNDIVKVAYGIKNNQNLFRINGINKMENELWEYVIKKISSIDFGEFTKQGFQIEKPSEEKIKVSNAKILDGRVVFDVEYPLKAVSSNYALKDRFAINVPSELGSMHKKAVELADKMVQAKSRGDPFDLSAIDYTCPIRIKVSYIPDSPNGEIIVLRNYDPIITKDNYIFQFAADDTYIMPDTSSCLGQINGIPCDCP